MEKLEGEKRPERNKKLRKRRTFHGSSIQQTLTPWRSLQTSSIDSAGETLAKTPMNRSYSVRKPLRVVSASKASSNSSFFSSTRKDKSNSASKMFGTRTIEPVVKSKTPVAFTMPKTQGFYSYNSCYGKTDLVEDCISDDRHSPESLGKSSDDLSNSGEKPSMLPSLLPRKSKKLDFVTKDSTNVKTGVLKTKLDKMPSVSSTTESAAASMVVKTTESSVIAKSSSSLTNQSSSSSVVTVSSSSSSSSMIASYKQSSTNQDFSHSLHDEPKEDEEFSNLSARNVAKKDSFSSRNPDLLVCSGEKQNKDEGKPERKKLKVSRRCSGSSSRKALQEARIQRLKSNLQNTTKEFEIGCSVSLTPSPPDVAEILPSSIPEADQIFMAQKTTPSPCGSINKSKLETETPLSASTTSPQGFESSTKTYKDWMHLFEEPFPRRSPRLSSLPSSTTKDQEYMDLMENFSPLTSQRRARRRKKQLIGRSKCSQGNSHMKGSTGDQSVLLQEVNAPVSPLVLAEKEASPPILQMSVAEDSVRKKEESLKRHKTEKPEKNVSSKKQKTTTCLNQAEENGSLVPSTSPHVSGDEMFHFPKPPAVLSGVRGPYSMVVDFALPDKDYAKLKLAKIKGNQTKKSANKDWEVIPSHREKQNLNKKFVTERDQESKRAKVGRDGASHGVYRSTDSEMDRMQSKADIKETNVTNEREMNAFPRETSHDKNKSERKKVDILSCKLDEDNGVIPFTPNTKRDWNVTVENESNDNQSEGTLPESTDSENVLSGSILQNLQVPSIIDKDSKPSVCFGKKHLGNSVSLSSLSKYGPEFGAISVEKRSPEIQKMCVHEDECHGIQEHADNSKNYSPKGERSPPLKECEKFVGNEMKGNETKIRKDYVPSSQESCASQSPNDLKGLLVLNGKVEKKSHPISNSNHALPHQEQPQEQKAGSDTLDSENIVSHGIPGNLPGNLPGTIPSTSKSEKDVVQNSISEGGQMIGKSQEHEDAKTVLEGVGVNKICDDKQTLLSQEKHDLDHVNQLVDHSSSQDLKTSKELPCSSENNIEMTSAVNQPTLNMTRAFPLGNAEMGSPVNQVAESHCGVDTEMGSIVSQQSQNSECVKVANGNFKNPLRNMKPPLSCITEDFNDNTPGSIKGSVPLYSSPEESNEQAYHQRSLCFDTEEFSSHMVPDVPVDQNTEEFALAESVSLEPSIGDTATPHGKASVPHGSSVMNNDMDQTENSVLTPVLMQACLQHDNSESNAVLSISMSTYDIPGHFNKKKDVIAVCLSHWVVVWVKMAGQEWTVLKTWALDNTDSEMFQMVKFLPCTSHLVLLVGGRFLSANGRVYGYSGTTSYDFQLDCKDVDDLMSFSSMCVLTDEEQSANSDGDVELVIAGATANGHVVSKWNLDCHCLNVKKCQVLTLPDGSGGITSLLTVDGNSYLLLGSTGTHLLLWNSKSCDLLKEINLSMSGLDTFDCLHAVTEMGLVFLTMCQRPATHKEKFASDGSSCLLYALNPLSNRLQCLQSFSFQEQTARCSSVDGQYVALGHQDGMASLMRMAAPKHSATFPVFQGAIETVSFHPSRPIIAFGGKNACVHVYSLS